MNFLILYINTEQIGILNEADDIFLIGAVAINGFYLYGNFSMCLNGFMQNIVDFSCPHAVFLMKSTVWQLTELFFFLWL